MQPERGKMVIEQDAVADFEQWFLALQELTFDILDPNEWLDRWGQGYSPEEAIAHGPEDGD